MRIVLPPPLTAPPPEQSRIRDFKLLLSNQVRVAWNTLRQQPAKTFFGLVVLSLLALSLFASLGVYAYGALKTMQPQIVQGFLSLLFMGGLAGQIFFGVTAAFSSLYMSEDLELLFMAPVSHKAVFAVKSLSVFGSNFFVAFILVFLPGIFSGLMFEAGALYYILVIVVCCGLLLIGTAIAELINLLVMRLVPPHRSKEAIGFIGAITGVVMALLFQVPNLLMSSQGKADPGAWLAGQGQMLKIMDFFPWGWGSQALTKGISGNYPGALAWSLLLLILGIILFLLAFILVERGFRRGFISLSQGEGGRRRKLRRPSADLTVECPQGNLSYLLQQDTAAEASAWSGIWAVAKKDLLTFKRDTREWFSIVMPLILMAFFVGQYFVAPSEASRSSMVTVLIMYTIMFSGNMALRAFGREGESDWLLNTVPLGGWPVVWGKLIAAVLPTLILMEAMLVGTAVAVGIPTRLIMVLVPSVIFLSLGSSSIGLYYSINNARYNPDKPQMRIAPGASFLMFGVNLFYLLILALGLCYISPPAELVAGLRTLPPIIYNGGFLGTIQYGLYLLSRPVLWTPVPRILLGIIVVFGSWALVFFGFMALTVRQSRKGFRVEFVTGGGRKKVRGKKR